MLEKEGGSWGMGSKPAWYQEAPRLQGGSGLGILLEYGCSPVTQ